METMCLRLRALWPGDWPLSKILQKQRTTKNVEKYHSRKRIYPLLQVPTLTTLLLTTTIKLIFLSTFLIHMLILIQSIVINLFAGELLGASSIIDVRGDGLPSRWPGANATGDAGHQDARYPRRGRGSRHKKSIGNQELAKYRNQFSMSFCQTFSSVCVKLQLY